MMSVHAAKGIVEGGTTRGLVEAEDRRRKEEAWTEKMHEEVEQSEDAEAVDWLLKDSREKGLKQSRLEGKRRKVGQWPYEELRGEPQGSQCGVGGNAALDEPGDIELKLMGGKFSKRAELPGIESKS